MRIASLICRFLLGAVFLFFGLNGFLHFLPPQPMPGPAGRFLGAIIETHYAVLIFLLQVVGGALLLAGQFVPLALTLLAPVIVNIVLFHLTMAPQGLPVALVVAALWIVVAIPYARLFTPLLSNAKPS